MTMFGAVCNTLDKPEQDVGLTTSIGGNYEHKLSKHWRLRHEGVFYGAKYKDNDYNDMYMSYGFGARYVYNRGDVSFGPTAACRYIGQVAYNYSVGLKVQTNYDITKQLSVNLTTHYIPTYYDKYKAILNGYTAGGQLRFFYAINSSKYLVFKTGYEYENTKDDVYTNNRTDLAFGFGTELPAEFHLYIEPSLQYTHYKGARWTVENYQFT